MYYCTTFLLNENDFLLNIDMSGECGVGMEEHMGVTPQKEGLR